MCLFEEKNDENKNIWKVRCVWNKNKTYRIEVLALIQASLDFELPLTHSAPMKSNRFYAVCFLILKFLIKIFGFESNSLTFVCIIIIWDLICIHYYCFGLSTFQQRHSIHFEYFVCQYAIHTCDLWSICFLLIRKLLARTHSIRTHTQNVNKNHPSLVHTIHAKFCELVPG